MGQVTAIYIEKLANLLFLKSANLQGSKYVSH